MRIIFRSLSNARSRELALQVAPVKYMRQVYRRLCHFFCFLRIVPLIIYFATCIRYLQIPLFTHFLSSRIVVPYSFAHINLFQRTLGVNFILCYYVHSCQKV